MNSTEGKKIPDDEIDLASLTRKTLYFISYPIRLLASNIKTTLLFIIAAVALSISLKFIIPKSYQSSFVIRPSDISDKLYLKILADLPTLLKEQQYETLSGLLHLKPSEVALISRISMVTTSYRVGNDSLNYTTITLGSTDYNLFIPVQTAILNYLENNPYYLKIKNLQKAQIDMTLKEIENDLPQLDSLKKIQLSRYTEKTQGQNDALLGSMLNAAAVYSVSIDRIDRKSKLMAQDVFIDRFQLIKGCVVSKHASSPPRILLIGIVLVPISLLFCIVFLFIKTQWAEIKKYFQPR